MTLTSGTLQGIGAVPGIAIGPVVILRSASPTLVTRHECDPRVEIDLLTSALATARQAITQVRERTLHVLGQAEAAIFDAHLLMLDDPELQTAVVQHITAHRVDAATAWQTVTQAFEATLRGLADPYLAARAADVHDVSERVLQILIGGSQTSVQLHEPSIIFADDLTPSQTMLFEKKDLLALCTAQGGPTSHVAILAKSLAIPAIVATGTSLLDVPQGTLAIVDGYQGAITIAPETSLVESYQHKIATMRQRENERRAMSHLLTFTNDGKRLEVFANIGSLQDAHAALDYGAEGVGLLRTEFLFLDRSQPPDEDEQVQLYQQLFAPLEKRPIIVRTMDIGGDKPAPYLPIAPESNPFLGMRGARLALQYPHVFLTQVRALLRASVNANLQIMFPMVTTLAELQHLRTFLENAREELRTQGLAYGSVQIGMMVEVPAAALTIDIFAPLVDFFSIGTNDLIQYTMAVDRTNASVAALGDGYEPAVLRLIAHIANQAHHYKKPIGVCGELASDPVLVPVLLGLGITELSMTPVAIPGVKDVVRQWRLDQAQTLARQAIMLGSGQMVREFLAKLHS